MAVMMDRRLVGWKVVELDDETVDWKDYMMADE